MPPYPQGTSASRLCSVPSSSLELSCTVMSGNFMRLEVFAVVFFSPLVESIANDGAYLGLEGRLA